MSVLGTLFGRIFHHGESGGATATASTGSASATTPAQATPAGSSPAPQSNIAAAPHPASAAASGGSASGGPAAASAGTATMERVDIEQVLNQMAQGSGQKLNWRSSIVDLMKLVGMDSSLQERKKLADELGYKGDKNDSASMNVWLHKEVMRKMQENGGKVPADLLD